MPATAHVPVDAVTTIEPVTDAACAALGRTGHVPVAEVAPAEDAEYAPV